jgi:hypothetical protein
MLLGGDERKKGNPLKGVLPLSGDGEFQRNTCSRRMDIENKLNRNGGLLSFSLLRKIIKFIYKFI